MSTSHDATSSQSAQILSQTELKTALSGSSGPSGTKIANFADADASCTLGIETDPSVTDPVMSDRGKENPFIMPPDDEIFLLRDKERQRKRKERIRQRKLHVHEKTTFASRVHCRPAAMIHFTRSEDALRRADKMAALADDTQFTLAITRERHVDKESLAEYIAKKREMFLVQYSLGVKRDEMRKLEEIAQAEERKLELAEQFLEEDAAMFDEFLKENDKNSVEAIKIAEGEAKAKMDKQNEIKKIHVAIMTVNSEISKLEETLKEFKTYKTFLDNITPVELKPNFKPSQDKKKVGDEKVSGGGTGGGKGSANVLTVGGGADHGKKTRNRRKSQVKGSGRCSTLQAPTHLTARKPSPCSQTKGSPSKSGASLPITDKEHSPHSEKVKKGKKGWGGGGKGSETTQHETDTASDQNQSLDLHFTDPQQVLNIFAELEEQNLSLIQNSQETEETLEEMKHAMRDTRKKMMVETRGLKEQIDKLHVLVKREKDKIREFQAKAKLYMQAESKEETPDKPTVSLDSVVREVYRNCIGDNDASMSTLEMLTTIENRLEELFDIIVTIPEDKVEAAEKEKEKERRLNMREQKLEEQRLYQEERVRRALERAKAEPKRMTGRRLVFRSQPPRQKRFRDDGAERARRREEEEFNYFFTWI